MNEEQVKKAHNELLGDLCKILGDFLDKYDAYNPSVADKVFAIVQNVVCELQEDSERAMGKMSPLTFYQIDHICYKIGEWYLSMKPLLEVQHNLGHMKDKLKTMICGE